MPPPEDAELPLDTARIAEIGTRRPPTETIELRRGLQAFVSQPLAAFVEHAPTTRRGASITLGAVRCGVYAFFDYDGEPIYVGQTRESLGQRIARHLTNQRTDAVAMAVLDPFEVLSIAVWPLPQYQDGLEGAAEHLDRLERTIFAKLIAESAFGKILNEKDPPDVAPCSIPAEIRGDIVGDDVRRERGHPDVRLARRAQVIARLAQIIAGRDVKVGLRRALSTQADRLAWLASRRFAALGGEAAVEAQPDEG